MLIAAGLAVAPRFAERVDGRASDGPFCADAVVDVEGNTYRGLEFGGMCWLDANLRTLTFRDGTSIDGASHFDRENHGVLYRFDHVVHPAGLCPKAWHVPSDAEFMRLETAVGMRVSQAEATGWRGDSGISRVLKAYDTAYGWTPEERARVNASGFSFTPSGAELNGRISGENRFGDLWTSTEFDQKRAWYRSVFWLSVTSPFRGDVEKVRRDAVAKEWSFSVRCVRALAQ